MRERFRGVEAPGEFATMKTHRFWRLALFAIAPVLIATTQAQAQTPRGPYYHRTTTPGFAAPRGVARDAPPPPPAGTLSPLENGALGDRLRPYTATSARAGAGAVAPGLGNSYSSRARVAPPSARPATRSPASRNYFPTARVGQGPNRNVEGVGRSGVDRCAPSRGGMLMGLR